MKYLFILLIATLTFQGRAFAASPFETEAETKCFYNLYRLWYAASSYVLAESLPAKAVLQPETMIDFVPKVKELRCPNGSAPYPAFSFFEGPKCPNGHHWETNANTSLEDLIQFIRRDLFHDDIAKLTNALASGSVVIRRAALDRLVDHGEKQPDIIAPLLKKALHNPDHVMRSIALERSVALVGFKSLKREAMMPILQEAVKNDDPFIRLKAIRTINSMEAKELLSPLINSLQDKTIEVHDEAQATLEKLTGQHHKTYAQWRKWADKR